MPLSRELIDRLPHVEGILNYLAPMPEKPMNLAYDPPPGVPRSTGVPEPHRMTIYDARPVAAQLSLDSEGLALFEHKSAMRDFYDEDELRRVYYPEAERSRQWFRMRAQPLASRREGLLGIPLRSESCWAPLAA